MKNEETIFLRLFVSFCLLFDLISSQRNKKQIEKRRERWHIFSLRVFFSSCESQWKCSFAFYLQLNFDLRKNVVSCAALPLQDTFISVSGKEKKRKDKWSKQKKKKKICLENLWRFSCLYVNSFLICHLSINDLCFSSFLFLYFFIGSSILRFFDSSILRLLRFINSIDSPINETKDENLRSSLVLIDK